MKLSVIIIFLLVCNLLMINIATAQQTTSACVPSNSSADCEGRACLRVGQVEVADCGVFSFCNNTPNSGLCSLFCDSSFLIIGACEEAPEPEPNPNICEPECPSGSSCSEGACVSDTFPLPADCADGLVRMGPRFICTEEPEGYCESASDCKSNQFCIDNICQFIRVDEPSCIGSQACKNGYICQNGTAICRPPNEG